MISVRGFCFDLLESCYRLVDAKWRHGYCVWPQGLDWRRPYMYVRQRPLVCQRHACHTSVNWNSTDQCACCQISRAWKNPKQRPWPLDTSMPWKPDEPFWLTKNSRLVWYCFLSQAGTSSSTVHPLSGALESPSLPWENGFPHGNRHLPHKWDRDICQQWHPSIVVQTTTTTFTIEGAHVARRICSCLTRLSSISQDDRHSGSNQKFKPCASRPSINEPLLQNA